MVAPHQGRVSYRLALDRLARCSDLRFRMLGPQRLAECEGVGGVIGKDGDWLIMLLTGTSCGPLEVSVPPEVKLGIYINTEFHLLRTICRESLGPEIFRIMDGIQRAAFVSDGHHSQNHSRIFGCWLIYSNL